MQTQWEKYEKEGYHEQCEVNAGQAGQQVTGIVVYVVNSKDVKPQDWGILIPFPQDKFLLFGLP